MIVLYLYLTMVLKVKCNLLLKSLQTITFPLRLFQALLIIQLKQSNIVLTYGQTDENEMRMGATTSLFAQMFTIDILYYRYIALNYQSSLDFITQSKIALDNYRKHLSNIDFKHINKSDSLYLS